MCFRDALFKIMSFLFWPREKKLAELKQQVVTLKSSIAKEEERLADLKLKVHLFSSGEYKADDQVHPETNARGVSMCKTSSSPSAMSILGKKQTAGCTREGSVLFLSNEAIAKGRFGALLRRQAGANVSTPCSCYKVGEGLTEATRQLQPVPGHSKAGKMRPPQEWLNTATCPRHWC